MKLKVLILGLFCLFSIESLQAADDPECQFWNKLAYNLSHTSEQNGGKLNFTCNSSCSNITCSGHFKAPAILGNYDLDLCFGLQLNHCKRPVTMDYYLDAPDRNTNISGSISHNDSFDLPGPKVYGIESTIVIIVEMVQVNSTHVLFGVNSNLRINIGPLPSFQNNQRVLPPTYIDVLPCTDQRKQNPLKSPKVCTPSSNPTKKPLLTTTPKAPKSTPKPAVTSKPTVTSKTYNQSCELGASHCDKNEMCRATTDKNSLTRAGVCVCIPSASLSGTTGDCELSSETTQKPAGSTTQPTAAPSVTIAQTGEAKKAGINTAGSTTQPTAAPSVTIAQTGEMKKAGINMTAVIIGAVFGGVLLIVVAVSIIIFIGRRRRRADVYGTHQLLSNNDDDDDDTNVVI